MSDEVRGSLADAVADWTPPWQRTQLVAEPVGDVEVTPELAEEVTAVDDEPVVVAYAQVEEPAAQVGPEPVDVPGAEQEPEPTPAVPSEPLPEVDDLPATLEAILMIVDEPVGEIMLGQILDRPAAEITATLETLAVEYTEQGRGFDLRRQAGGWRFYTRDEYAAYVERFVLDGQQARLTKAALETLAVVAYKQPVTRARISGIRGVNCDGVIRTLLSRGLVEECGAEPDSGAHLYRTTVLFLEKLGINSVDELPPLAPFLPDDLDDLTDGAVDA